MLARNRQQHLTVGPPNPTHDPFGGKCVRLPHSLHGSNPLLSWKITRMLNMTQGSIYQIIAATFPGGSKELGFNKRKRYGVGKG